MKNLNQFGHAFTWLCLAFSFSSNAQEITNLSPGESYKFLEGPVWDGEANLYFTDIDNNTIVKYNSIQQTFSPILTNSSAANGLMFNKDNNLVVCEGDSGRVTERKTDGSLIKTIVSEYSNIRLNRPNDLCIDSKGGIYFSDPTWGTQFQTKNRVYYLSPEGKLDELIDDMERPNGVILSTDGKTLYVNNSWSPNVRAYDVQENGLLNNERIFTTLRMPNNTTNISGADGMAIDRNDNVYITTEVGVQVFDKNGRAIQFITMPEKSTNCTFGGPDMTTLFVTAGKNLYSMELSNTGFRHPFDLPVVDNPGPTTPTTPTTPTPTPNEQKPFKNHSIPGVIQVEDYDQGGEGVAYHDTNSFNEGRLTRLDQGVDLERSKDTDEGINIGWIANEEWLEYTVANITAGTYDITFRVASNNNNNKSISAKLDNRDLGTIAIPDTGNWQNWEDVTLENVTLTEGQQVLRLDIIGGGYNLNWVAFSPSQITTTTPTTPSTPDATAYSIRAKGVSGEEQIVLQINNEDIQTFTLTQSWATYSVNSNNTGAIRVNYINDQPGRDLEVDFVSKNDQVFQAEDQSTNTSAWMNGRCGGGSNTQLMHCSGYIEFAQTGNKIANQKQLGEMVLYPNPTKDLVNIDFEQTIKNGSIKIVDNLGRTVYTQKVTNKERLSIPTNTLQNGFYTVLIFDGQLSNNASFIKK